MLCVTRPSASFEAAGLPQTRRHRDDTLVHVIVIGDQAISQPKSVASHELCPPGLRQNKKTKKQKQKTKKQKNRKRRMKKKQKQKTFNSLLFVYLFALCVCFPPPPSLYFFSLSIVCLCLACLWPTCTECFVGRWRPHATYVSLSASAPLGISSLVFVGSPFSTTCYHLFRPLRPSACAAPRFTKRVVAVCGVKGPCGGRAHPSEGGQSAMSFAPPLPYNPRPLLPTCL